VRRIKNILIKKEKGAFGFVEKNLIGLVLPGR
jgi:hypothetical protein